MKNICLVFYNSNNSSQHMNQLNNINEIINELYERFLFLKKSIKKNINSEKNIL